MRTLLTSHGPLVSNSDNGLSFRRADVEAALDTLIGPDSDGDGVADPNDNCRDVANADQRDIDQDGFGNVCDCDFNDDGGCGQPDYSILLTCFGKATGPGSGPPDDPTCEESDMNGDGGVGQPDYSLFLSLLGGMPGPSGLACAGSIPCP